MFPFLLALAAPSSVLAAAERTAAQEAAKRVSQCGLGPVTTHYEPDLQEDVLVASSAQSATDDQLTNVQRRFEAILNTKAEVWMKGRAHDWLSARGLLGRIPKYQKGVTDDGVFTRQVETLCGPKAKGAFQSKYGFHALSPDWVKRELNPSDLSGDTLACLMNVTAVAGFEFGFIGNEYYQR